MGPRRGGDPDSLVADSTKARTIWAGSQSMKVLMTLSQLLGTGTRVTQRATKTSKV